MGLFRKTAEHHFERGLFLYGQRKLVRAAVQFARASEKDPTDDRFHLYHGVAMAKLRLVKEAEAAFEAAVMCRGPLREEAMECLSALRTPSDEGIDWTFIDAAASVVEAAVSITDLVLGSDD